LSAVETTPVPIGFERKSRSPRSDAALERIRSGSIRPVTERPNLGSASVTVWPAADDRAASATLAAAPSKMAVMTSGGSPSGKPATFSASTTSPPMA
jgi:hypothetical protein